VAVLVLLKAYRLPVATAKLLVSLAFLFNLPATEVLLAKLVQVEVELAALEHRVPFSAGRLRV
jgi:hypothetical protein